MRKCIAIKLKQATSLKTKQLFQIISTEHFSLLRSHSVGSGNVENLKTVKGIRHGHERKLKQHAFWKMVI